MIGIEFHLHCQELEVEYHWQNVEVEKQLSEHHVVENHELQFVLHNYECLSLLLHLFDLVHSSLIKHFDYWVHSQHEFKETFING